MTPRKLFALVTLVGIVPAIAMVRLQMTPTGGSTAASMSSIALYVAMIIIPVGGGQKRGQNGGEVVPGQASSSE